jgi:signal transduction histidine kinase
MGISAEASNGPSGFGFFSIGERLKYLGGHLEVESEPGWGTRVTLQVPLKY